jgi:hypothetical protein
MQASYKCKKLAASVELPILMEKELWITVLLRALKT